MWSFLSGIWKRLPSPGYRNLGGGWPALLFALGLTLLTYLCWNLAYIRIIDRRYQSLQFEEIDTAPDATRAAERVIEMTRCDPKLRDSLARVLTPRAGGRPAHGRLEDLFNAIDNEGAETRSTLLERLATGDRKMASFPPGYLVTNPVTGEALVQAMERQDDGRWGKSLSARERGVEERVMLVRLSDQFLARMQPPIRELNRLGGWVQWATLFVAYYVLALLLRRWLMLRRTSDLGGSVQSAVEVRGWFNELRQASDSGYYATVSFLIGLLPSLGFVGTVLGMGEALLNADGLFSATDKQRTINLITRELGYAFDTTLVALILGILTGIAASALRSYETHRLRAAEVARLASVEGSHG